jgi:DNA-binding NarL/FixJ family response regulator
MGGVRQDKAAARGQSDPGICSGTPVASIDAAPRRLLILSDIRFLRESLAEVLARDGAFTISGSAATLAEALAVSRAAAPHATLIDAVFPDGLAAARQRGTLSPQTPVVALTVAETEVNVIAWADAGIFGYVPRSTALDELVGFLCDIVRGEQTCSTRVVAALLRWISRSSRADARALPQARPPTLTGREEQVVRLISGGLSNKEIARRLNIGLATTKSHVHNLLPKLELDRPGQVAQWSRDHGWPPRGEP